MKFILPQAESRYHTHRILDLCEFLTAKVVEPFLKTNGVRWDPRFHDFFTCDRNENPLEAVGTIDFHPPVLFLGYLSQIEENIKRAMEDLGIQTGRFVREMFPNSCAIRVVRIPILHNPTAQAEPPAVSMSPAQGNRVLRDLLGFEARNGRFEFAASEALERLSTLTRERIEAACASPVRESKSTREVRRVASPITVKSTERCLNELTEFMRWAKQHQYETVAVMPEK